MFFHVEYILSFSFLSALYASANIGEIRKKKTSGGKRLHFFSNISMKVEHEKEIELNVSKLLFVVVAFGNGRYKISH